MASRSRGPAEPYRLPSNQTLTQLHRQLEVRINHDRPITFGWADNPNSYFQSHSLDDEPDSPSTLHMVTVVHDDGLVKSSCILGSTGEAPNALKRFAIIDYDSILIALGPFIALLQLQSPVLKRKVKTDWVTCIGAYYSPQTHYYLSDGDFDATAASYDGVVLWTNPGADIFTNGFSRSKAKSLRSTGITTSIARTFKPINYSKRRRTKP